MVDRVRSIGDGVAWRVLDYDRVNLRLLSEHQPISVPQVDSGLRTELEELLRLGEEGGRIILNSITNCLRVGDLTVYRPDTGEVRVVEVKSGGKTTARTRRQGDYSLLVQEALKSDIHPMGDIHLQRIIAKKPQRTYVFSLERAILKAEDKGTATRRFGDYLSIGVFDLGQIISHVAKERWPQSWAPVLDGLLSVKARKSDFVTPMMDNISVIGTFSPNVAPYAIFPMERRLRFGLLTGEFFVMTLLNVSEFARWLEKRGWETEILTAAADPPQPDGTPDHVPVLRVTKGPRSVEVGMAIFLAAAIELNMPETIESVIEATINREPDGYVQVGFPNTGKYAWD